MKRFPCKAISYLLSLVFCICLLTMSVMADDAESQTTARIGETDFETLAEAVANALAGDTVELLSNTELMGSIFVENNITIKGNGFSVLNPEGEAFSLFSSCTFENISIVSPRGFGIGDSYTDYNGLSITLRNVSVSASQRGLSVNAGGASGLRLAMNGCNFSGVNNADRGISIYNSPNSYISVEDSILCGFGYGILLGGNGEAQKGSISLNNSSVINCSNCALGVNTSGNSIDVFGGSIELFLMDSRVSNTFSFTDVTFASSFTPCISEDSYACSVLQSVPSGEKISFRYTGSVYDGELKITSGSFTIDPTDYLADKRIAQQNDAGNWVVAIGNTNHGMSLSLDGSIGLYYYVDADAYFPDGIAPDGTYVELTYDHSVTLDPEETFSTDRIILSSGMKESDGTYKITGIRLMPVQIDEPTAICLYSPAGELLWEKSMSIREYCRVIEENNLGGTKMVRLAQAICDYGTFAEIYFGYGEPLQTADSSRIARVSAEDLEPYLEQNSVTEEDSGIEFMGATFIAWSNSALRLYYVPVAENYSPEWTVNGRTDNVSVGSNSTGNYVEFSGISARDLGETNDFSDGGEFTASYSPMIYCANILKKPGSSLNMKNLARSIYLYYAAAVNYFG